MSRVLVTGATGAIGSALVRRLLADPDYDVRVADRKAAPQWMREGCEIASGDLREHERAAAAMRGCDRVVHLAGPSADAQGDYSLIAAGAALDSAILRAAIDRRVQRLVYVSCAYDEKQPGAPMAGEAGRANPSSTISARAFAELLGERLCQAAHAEHGLPVAVCRVSPAPVDAERALDAIVAALS